MTHRIVAVLGSLALLGTCLAACGGEVVVAPPPPPVAAPAEMAPSEFQPCHAVTDCRGTPNPIVGPCMEGRKSESRWSCTGNRCVPVAECIEVVR